MKRLWTSVFLLCACLVARAEVQPGHWHDPDRVGVGISVHGTKDGYFVTVLDYAADGQPLWLFASDVKPTGLHLDPGGPLFAGTLYRGEGTPLRSQQAPRFAAMPAGRISMSQFGSILTVSLEFSPPAGCTACEPLVIGGHYVRLL